MRHRMTKASTFAYERCLFVQGVDSLSERMPLWIEYRSFSSIQMNILFRVINSATVGAAAAVAAIVHPLQARSKKFYIFQAAFNQCGLLLCGFFLHFVLLESGVEIIEPLSSLRWHGITLRSGSEVLHKRVYDEHFSLPRPLALFSTHPEGCTYIIAKHLKMIWDLSSSSSSSISAGKNLHCLV